MPLLMSKARLFRPFLKLRLKLVGLVEMVPSMARLLLPVNNDYVLYTGGNRLLHNVLNCGLVNYRPASLWAAPLLPAETVFPNLPQELPLFLFSSLSYVLSVSFTLYFNKFKRL